MKGAEREITGLLAIKNEISFWRDQQEFYREKADACARKEAQLTQIISTQTYEAAAPVQAEWISTQDASLLVGLSEDTTLRRFKADPSIVARLPGSRNYRFNRAALQKKLAECGLLEKPTK